jgi:hypothetical protein
MKDSLMYRFIYTTCVFGLLIIAGGSVHNFLMANGIQPPSDYQAAQVLQQQLIANGEPQAVLDTAAALVKLLAP